jgi:hypothetical protein
MISKNKDDLFASGQFGPHILDRQIRGAIQICLLLMSEENPTREQVKSKLIQHLDIQLQDLDSIKREMP